MLALLVYVSCLVVMVTGHARLIEPPSRSSMWRYGFDNPVNYNDNELFCGGYQRQWGPNKGKCGVCGDPWDAPEPRDNEDGGKYGNKIIVRTYKSGQTVPCTVDVTTAHRGFFEYRLCPVVEGKKVDQSCMEQNLLSLVDGGTKEYVPTTGHWKGLLTVQLKLPTALSCERCVFQWKYTTGNTWGDCGNGTSTQGCGPQETFMGCADIAILA